MTLAVASGLAALSAGTASAASAASAASSVPAPAPVAPSSADVAAAHAAATATLGTVGHFLAAGGQKPQGSAQQQETAAAALAPRLDSTTVPVYYLAAAFVADTSAAGTGAPVANLAFLATDAVGTSGAHASVWAAKVGTAWKVVNIAQGSDETAYAGRAQPGGTVFEEPQIGAWYQLLGGRVLPLDDTARQSVGTQGMSLADYHRLVRSRYADKLPGSAYDRAGVAGGFQPRNAALGKGSGSGADGTDSAAVLGIGGAVLAAGGVGLVGYRHTRRRGKTT
ncbi:hypothetical protein [Catenulispora sp. GP43]|uniref:hypothetical protein n=1 Tax=Catenulispora sp. GP43 TaxID=3156263 RepID=UPI0035173857